MERVDGKELKATDMSRLKLQYKNRTFYITRNGTAFNSAEVHRSDEKPRENFDRDEFNPTERKRTFKLLMQIDRELSSKFTIQFY